MLLLAFNCSVLAASNSETSIVDEINSLQREVARLEGEQEALFSQIRFQIRGTTKGLVTRNFLTGAGREEAIDFNGGLLSDGVLGQQQAKFTLRMGVGSKVQISNDLTGSLNWASKSTDLKADNFSFQVAEQNWQVRAGTYWAGFTPLTLFYAAYDPEFESPIFQFQRAEERLDLGIEANKRKLEGFQARYALDNFEAEGLLARVQSKDNGAPFHRYLWGLSSYLQPLVGLGVGANYVTLKDDSASGRGAPLTSELLGAVGELQLKGLTISTECVRSLYDENALAGLPAIRDYAFNIGLEYRRDALTVKASYIGNGPFFYAPTAQSRDYGLDSLGASWFGLDEQLTATGQEVDSAANEPLPFGLATPNRKGTRLEFSLGQRAYFEHLNLTEVRPADDAGSIVAAITSPRHLVVDKIGGSFNLGELIKRRDLASYAGRIDLLGNYQNSQTTRKGPEGEAFALCKRILDLGFSYDLQPGWTLFVGNKKIAVEQRKQAEQEDNANYLRAGVRVEISPQTALFFGCQRANGNDDFQAQSLYLMLKAGF
jgi:hypothetical protein